MKKMILFAISFLAANQVWAQQSSTSAPASSVETVNADNVPVEEYVPKVIIEGKWGNEPGEFGIWGVMSEGDQIKYVPTSLAVDSNGNVYVLDLVNERIEKFTKHGKYSKSLLIESFSGKRHVAETNLMVDKNNLSARVGPDNPNRIFVKQKITVIEPDFNVVGINIVIDSKDNLYYYLKRLKDSKETSEVWEYKADKLVKKNNFSKKESLPAKFKLHLVGYNQWELGVVEAAAPAKESNKYRINIRKEKEDSVIEVNDNYGKQVSKTLVKPTEAYQRARAKYGRAKSEVYFEKMLDNGNFQVRTVNGDLENISTEEREYTPEGKLVRRIKSPPGYSHGIDVGENGVKVVRWVIQKSN